MYQRISVKIKDILTLQIPALLEKQVIQLQPLYPCLHCTSSSLSALYNPWSASGVFFVLYLGRRTVEKLGVLVFQMRVCFVFFLLICAPSVLLYDCWKRSPGRNHLDLRLADSDICESISFLREFIFKLAPKKVILYR